MGTVTVTSSTLVGVNAVPIRVEVDLLQRLPRYCIVGLPEAQVKETAERVRSAIEACGFEHPRVRIVVNLSPADVKKVANGFDLAIAVGILAASGQIPMPDPLVTYLGELSLGGAVRPVRGVVAAAEAAAKVGGHVVTSMDGGIGALAGSVLGIRTLADVADLGNRSTVLQAPKASLPHAVDTSDIIGNLAAIDGFVEAACTGRPLLLVGPPGCGKSMLARRFGSILAPMTSTESLEVTRIHEAAGLGIAPVSERPFRAPHHTVSVAGMVGDRLLRPGELTLAHHGVLLLDEFDEFPRAVIDPVWAAARDHEITVVHQGCILKLPTRFQLIMAVNHDGGPAARARPHPMLDAAIRVELSRVEHSALTPHWPSSETLRARVLEAPCSKT